MSTIYPITVPQWGLEMTEGTVAAWHIAVGGRIVKGQELVDIETSKIINTMEAMADAPGVVRRLVAAVGDTLAVGALMAVTADDSVSDSEIDLYLAGRTAMGDKSTAAPATTVPEAAATTPVPVSVTAAPATAPTSPAPATAAGAVAAADLDADALKRVTECNQAAHASPVARRLANRLGVDLSTVMGTGQHGRVSYDDVIGLQQTTEHLYADSPTISREEIVQRNQYVVASPIARRFANREGVYLKPIVGTGRNGRISVNDVETLLCNSSNETAHGRTLERIVDVRSGPAARKLAAELGVDLASVKASGPRKLVLKQDVQNAFDRPKLKPEPSAPVNDFELIPLTSMRRAIAAGLTLSKQTIPHFYLTADLELDALMQLRTALNEQSAGQRRLSINDFLLRATAMALKDVPSANVHFTEAGIKRFAGVHLCIAVAIEGGLVTPVIRDAETQSVFAIAAEAAGLAESARNRSLTAAQLGGGTFTVSNLGMFGVRNFDAVINPPQGAILAIGTIRREAKETASGGVVFSSIMSVTLSCDHRAIDGAVGASLLSALRKYVQQPYSLLG